MTYVLGHSAAELRRLAVQAELLDGLTEDALRRAGIAAGMHVLDLGSGAVAIDTLAGRLRREAFEADALVVAPSFVNAWAAA